ncbi:hypothetical protein F4778DRAFT_246087 [Xylariomycetidae sp. FL2044]|nr:hypothetical protein F4778DRAFT_246087 [Xylariomycetidae sp. FL2044]
MHSNTTMDMSSIKTDVFTDKGNQDFHCFALFPPEIQVRVLQLAIAQPSVVTRTSGVVTPEQRLVRYNNIKNILDLSSTILESLTFERPLPNTGIVERFLERQEDTSDARFQEIFIHPCDPPGHEAFINWSVDYLFVQRGTSLSDIELEQYQNLRYLAMEYASPFWGNSRRNAQGVDLIRSLPNLKRVVILLGSMDCKLSILPGKKKERKLLLKQGLRAAQEEVHRALENNTDADWKRPAVHVCLRSRFWDTKAPMVPPHKWLFNPDDA